MKIIDKLACPADYRCNDCKFYIHTGSWRGYVMISEGNNCHLQHPNKGMVIDWKSLAFVYQRVKRKEIRPYSIDTILCEDYENN